MTPRPRWLRLAALAVTLLLAACVPTPATPVATVQPTAAQASAPTPAATAGANPASLADLEHPDRRCTGDADCQVKNVGNCCGAFPTCVNKAAPVDAQAVKAQCAREHRFGMCHAIAVRGCSCVQGQCNNVTGIGAPTGKP